MLRLVLEATAACGYTVGSLYHAMDILDLPIALIGLAWMIAVRFIPPVVPTMGLFWITYALLVYQLISFHDLNACLLEECQTSQVYSYIVLGSTALFWFSMRDKNTKYQIKEQPKVELKVEPKVEPVVEPKVAVEREIFPALKIRIQSDNKKDTSLQLNMGRSLQPKWV